MRPESTLEEDTCNWPESDRPGFSAEATHNSLSCSPEVPICPPSSLLSAL